jgi:hypothetical protein
VDNDTRLRQGSLNSLPATVVLAPTPWQRGASILLTDRLSPMSLRQPDTLLCTPVPTFPRSIFFPAVTMPIVGSISHAVSCPRDGSKWYTCSSGSMFVGCCKHNPCKYGCEASYVGAALLTQDAFDMLPNASCSTGSNFYSCDLGNFNETYRGNQTYYWGCCKSNACLSRPPGC